MNKKLKNIFIGGAVPALSLPLALTAIVGCSSEEHVYDKLAHRIKEDALEEFIGNRHDIDGITSIHRPTFETKTICNYLMGSEEFDGRIHEIMGNIFVHKDDYNIEMGLGENGGFNMYFDIPANDPEMAPIIIQCHTDMVWNIEPGFSANHPIPHKVTVNNREALQSEDANHKHSSLGSDNGMGIALCLALAKNRSAFKHGKIRILMTTDEEDGPSGAKFVPCDNEDALNNWFVDEALNEYIPYLLNVDLEDTLKTATSCGGTQAANWSKKFTLVDVPEGKKLHYVHVRGLTGDYDARGYPAGQLNAFKLAFEFLGEINAMDGATDTVQLVRAYGSSPDEEILNNKIPKEAYIYFYSNDWSESDMTAAKEWLYLKYSSFEPLVEFTVGDAEGPSNPKAISCTPSGDEDSDTQKIIDFINLMPCGLKKVGEDQWDPRTSLNIAGVRIDDGTYAEPGELYINLLGRSSLPEDLGIDPDTVTDKDKWTGFMQQFLGFTKKFSSVDWHPTGWTPLWEYKEGNALHESLMEGGKKLKLKLKSYDELGWFEVAYFDLHTNQILSMGDIGFDITGAHTPEETFYIDTMESTIKLVLYAIQHAPYVHIPFGPQVTRKEEQHG